MSFGKKYIAKNISSKAHITTDLSKELLNRFIDLIKNTSKNKIIKISRLGSFHYRTTPQRIGRNPKSKEEYIISERLKLTFKASGKIKELLN